MLFQFSIPPHDLSADRAPQVVGMPATNASSHFGLLDLPSLRKRAERLLKALKKQ